MTESQKIKLMSKPEFGLGKKGDKPSAKFIQDSTEFQREVSKAANKEESPTRLSARKEPADESKGESGLKKQSPPQ